MTIHIRVRTPATTRPGLRRSRRIHRALRNTERLVASAAHLAVWAVVLYVIVAAAIHTGAP